MKQFKRAMVTAALLITASLLYMAGCGAPTDSAGEAYNLYHGLDLMENASPSVTIHQGEAVGRDAWFEFTIGNVDSEIMAPGVYDGWCMEWNKPIAQQGDTHENLQMYSTNGQDRWKPLNYFLNIKNELKAEDPSLTFREFQAVIWVISEGPEFNLNTLSNDDIPPRLMKDGEPRFDKQKVQDIAADIKAGAGSFEYGPNTTYAMFMKTGDDEQDVMVPVDPQTVSHGFVDGVTPVNLPDDGERTYPVIQADWEGPGGDKRWLGWNLGATDAPESFDDDDINRAGWYFQFNRSQGYYHDGPNDEPLSYFPARSANAPPLSELDTDWTENDPCTELLGDDWRVPTIVEWEAASAANAGSLFNLHLAGYLNNTGFILDSRGDQGLYWSSTRFDDGNDETTNNLGKAFFLEPEDAFLTSVLDTPMDLGASLRCIED